MNRVEAAVNDDGSIALRVWRKGRRSTQLVFWCDLDCGTAMAGAKALWLAAEDAKAREAHPLAPQPQDPRGSP